MKPIFIFILITFMVAGYYVIYNKEQPNIAISANSELAEKEVEAMQSQKKQTAEKSTEVEQSIATIKQRADIRHDKITKLMQQIDVTPSRVPDLPEIPTLEAPVDLVNRHRNAAQLDLGVGHTLPRNVMTEVTQETGLTQEEIEQAMNR